MALQEEDLEHQHLVIVGPAAPGWIRLFIQEDGMGFPEVQDIDMGGAVLQWIVLLRQLLKSGLLV
jgi:hypothetical protein